MTSKETSTVEEKMKLRAVHGFDPKQMGYREKIELTDFLKNQGLISEDFSRPITLDEMFTKLLKATKNVGHEQRHMLGTNENQQRRYETFQMSEQYDIVYDRELCDSEDDGNSHKLDLPRPGNDIDQENALMTIESKEYGIKENTSNIQNVEESTKLEEMEKVEQKGVLKHMSHFDESSNSKTVDPCRFVLTFRRGNTMETFPPANIGDSIGWWKARNLNSREIGFISRSRVVIEKDQQTSKTTLNDLPLELLDFVLETAFLHWILNFLSDQRNQDVIKTLSSVDFCWFQRMTSKRNKNRIWQRLKDFYEKPKKRSAIIRNNRNYIFENILPEDNLLASLLSLNCITEKQSHSIQLRHSIQDKNAELLYVMRSFDETKFSNFLKCLRQTNQETVARIMENGGVTIKVEVTNCGATRTESILHQRISDLRNRTKPRSNQTNKLISQLKAEDIEILNSQLDRQTVVVWIWCHSQAAIENIQRLYESNQLKAIFVEFASTRPSTSESNQSTVINIDSNQFKKTVVMRPVSVNLVERFAFGKNEKVYGVTKLRNEIYVFLRSSSGYVIYVFEDENPFNLQNKIKITEIALYWDIVSCEKENCLYVSDIRANCVWKITRETLEKYNIIKWLSIDYPPLTLSVSSGQLLVVNNTTSKLMIYGSEAELLRSIQLPRDIENPIHAVQTLFGNFIIIHRWDGKEMDESGDSGSSGPKAKTKFVVGLSELTRDGQMVIRRFISPNERQNLNYPMYLSFDSDDQVFVADAYNTRVILLDSDLKWNQILCPIKEGKGERIRMPIRFCYDGKKKQLIVAEEEISVFNLSRK